MDFKQRKADHQKNSTKGFTGGFHRIVFWVIMGVVLACLFAVVFGIAVKFLWGATLTPLFGFPELSYWQAVGIVLLARLIFGGFGHRTHQKNSRTSWNEGNFGDRNSFLQKMHNRFHGWDIEEDSDDNDLPIPEQERKHYHEFWEKEGRQAFEEFLSRENIKPPKTY